MKGKRSKPAKTSNTVLAIMGASIAAFIVCMIVTYWVKGSVPDSLIDKVLDFGQWEAGFLAAIKIAKTIKGEKAQKEETENEGNY